MYKYLFWWTSPSNSYKEHILIHKEKFDEWDVRNHYEDAKIYCKTDSGEEVIEKMIEMFGYEEIEYEVNLKID